MSCFIKPKLCSQFLQMAHQSSASVFEQPINQTITETKRNRTTTPPVEEQEKCCDKTDETGQIIEPKKRKRIRRAPNLIEGQSEENQQQQQGEEDNNAMSTTNWWRPPKNLEVTVKNGIRYLQPYWGFFTGYAKRRWVGKTIAEVYATEFCNLLHPLYAKAACRKGRIFVNKCPMLNADHRIRNNEFFMHINHRHETEIPNLPIQILTETDDVLVLNKPAGLPVHPCGNYSTHSVLGLLRREYGRDHGLLSCLYRLDRTTTGLLMFAKNEHFDKHFKKLVRERKVVKEYVCKVEGKFPDGEIVCDAPIGVLCHHLGLRCVRPDGQEALSSFSLVRYLPADNTSVVSCTIVTGRTHQIRVHLQFLGHPIVGDRLYNDETWGPDKGKGANYGERTMEQLADDITKRHSKTQWILEHDEEYAQRLRQIGDDEFCAVDEFDLKNLSAGLDAMPTWDPICWGCSIKKKREMHESDWLMALHCRRYSTEGLEYEAPLPDWALINGNGVEEDGRNNAEEDKERAATTTTTTPTELRAQNA